MVQTVSYNASGEGNRSMVRNAWSWPADSMTNVPQPKIRPATLRW
jgi:hypothetical protein